MFITLIENLHHAWQIWGAQVEVKRQLPQDINTPLINLNPLGGLEISYFKVNVFQNETRLSLWQNLLSILTSCEAVKIYRKGFGGHV